MPRGSRATQVCTKTGIQQEMGRRTWRLYRFGSAALLLDGGNQIWSEQQWLLANEPVPLGGRKGVTQAEIHTAQQRGANQRGPRASNWHVAGCVHGHRVAGRGAAKRLLRRTRPLLAETFSLIGYVREGNLICGQIQNLGAWVKERKLRARLGFQGPVLYRAGRVWTGWGPFGRARLCGTKSVLTGQKWWRRLVGSAVGQNLV